VAFGKAKAAGVVLASATSIPVDPNASLDTAGKTIGQVSSALCSFLRRSELEPEWLCPANLTDDPHEEAYGARHNKLWPECTALDRISVPASAPHFPVLWASTTPLSRAKKAPFGECVEVIC
jgi:hypothetical protein